MTKAIIIITRFIRKIGRDHVRAYAAEASFFLIMSLVPFMMMFLSLLQYTPLSEVQVIDVIREFTPFEVTESLERIIGSIYRDSVAILSTTAVIAMWTAGKGVLGLSDGLNSVYGITETRNYFAIRIRAMFHTIFLMGGLVLAFSVIVTGNRFLSQILRLLPIPTVLQQMVLPLRILFMLVFLILLFSCLYVYLPNEERRFRNQLAGAVFSACSWVVFSVGFSFYLRVAGSMSLLYGSLTTLIIAMFWLYFCVYLFFIGAEINCYREDPRKF